MSDLRLLDPTHRDDPAFDPDGAQARRVRAAALRESPAPSRRRAPRGRRLALAGAVAAAVAVAVTVGTSTAPPDARAALVQAARQTGAADSGRVVIAIRGKDPATGYEADLRSEIRFQGDDLEIATTGRETIPGRGRIQSDRVLRLVEGIGYERSGARFRRIGRVDPVTFQVTGQYDDDGLVTLVRQARDVEAAEADGVTTYRGTTTAGAVEDAAPSAHGRAEGPAWNRAVRLEVAVGSDGLIRQIVVRDADFTRTTRYLDLGDPQRIERP